MRRTHLNDEVIRVKELRDKRKPILEAWDIAKGNIAVGVEVVTAERKAELIAWYKKMLDLDEEALSNIPQEVAKYIV